MSDLRGGEMNKILKELYEDSIFYGEDTKGVIILLSAIIPIVVVYTIGMWKWMMFCKTLFR